MPAMQEYEPASRGETFFSCSTTTVLSALLRMTFYRRRERRSKTAIVGVSEEERTNLEDVDVWEAVRSEAAAVHHQVLQPLNVDRLGTGHDALERRVAARRHSAVGREADL